MSIPANATLYRGTEGSTVNLDGQDHYYRLEPCNGVWYAAPWSDKYTCGPLMRSGATWEDATWAAHVAAMEAQA